MWFGDILKPGEIMDAGAVHETVTQMPAVFCGPQADAAFFVALAMAAFGLYSIYKLLTRRAGRSLPAEDSNSQFD